jgi:DNA-3-methyladenine glycosylase I
MLRYHDEEWGVPVHDDRLLFEHLMLDGFQAGLSWRTILNKRENFRRAFDGFEPERIARYTKRKIERLVADSGIVRNRQKIEATIGNARAYLRLREEVGSFDTFLWQFVGGETRQSPTG